MKNTTNVCRFLIACVSALFLASFAHAQTAAFAQETILTAPVDTSPTATWMNILTPVFVPIVVLGFKKLLPNIPGALLPALAGVLGIAFEYVNHFATGQTVSLAAGVGLGLAGVGIREVLDQLKKTVTQPA